MLVDTIAPCPTVFKSGSETALMVTTIATEIVIKPRSKSIVTMIFFRLYRSVIAPAGSVKINHGKRLKIAISAIKNGDLVTADANHG